MIQVYPILCLCQWHFVMKLVRVRERTVGLWHLLITSLCILHPGCLGAGAESLRACFLICKMRLIALT